MASIGSGIGVLAVGIHIRMDILCPFFLYPSDGHPLFSLSTKIRLTRVKVEILKEELSASLQYAELETILGDTGRSRALFELAVNQPLLDMPEVSTEYCVLITILVRLLFRCDFRPYLSFCFPTVGKSLISYNNRYEHRFPWDFKAEKKDSETRCCVTSVD